jgi:copper transport protein
VRRFARRLLALVVLSGAMVLAGAAPAWGHAALTGSEPADGAQLDVAPAEVTFRFNEPVTPSSADSVTVVGADGERVDLGLANEWTAPAVTVELPDSLPDGGYVASYVVMSQDGHLIRGATTFRIGEGGADVEAAAGAASSRGLDATGSIVRGALYLSMLIAVGGLLFLVAVLRGDGREGPFRRIVAGAAAVAIVATVASWFVQVAQSSVDGVAAMVSPAQLAAVADQPFGRAALIRLLGLAVLLVAVTLWRDRAGLAVASAGALVTVVSFALDGHSASTDPRWLVVVSDVVHVASAAAWFGGLVLLALAMRARRSADDVAGAGGLVARFSGVATVAVVGVGVAGIALSWAEVRTLEALFTTAYGWTLLAKVAIVVAVGAVGLHNNRRLVPSLRDQPTGEAWGRLHRTVRLEVAGLLVAVALTGFLVNIVPARTAVADTSAAGAAPFEATTGLGSEIHVEVVVDPAARGANEIHLYLMTHAGQPVDEGPRALTLNLSLPDAGIGPISRPATKIDESHFVAAVDDFAIAGDWLVEIEARIDDFVLERSQFTVPVS